MNGEHVDLNIVQYTQIYYFDDNNYDEYYDFTIDSCVYHEATLQYHGNNILPSVLVQISEHGVQHRERDYNSLRPLSG